MPSIVGYGSAGPGLCSVRIGGCETEMHDQISSPG